jgi:pimeloyl-ACP methyl ester carboxylesterase
VPKAKINGLTVHYQQMGQGNDLVMIHGLFANSAFWYFSVAQALASDYRVTVYDLRGHGYSDMPRYGYTSADMAADLQALLDHLGVGQVHVVGHSFGGAVGLHYAVLHPERVRSLTLADARVPSLQPPLPPRNTLYWRLLKVRLRQAGIEVPEDLPRVAYSFLEELARLQPRQKSVSSDPWSAATLLDGWNSNSRAAKRWYQLVHTTSASADFCSVSGLTVKQIRQMPQPTLAIFGEYSGCLITLRGLMENLPDCQRVIVPAVGHFHPLVKPDVCIQTLRQFILALKA